jgi:hypothetical protein
MKISSGLYETVYSSYEHNIGNKSACTVMRKKKLYDWLFRKIESMNVNMNCVSENIK